MTYQHNPDILETARELLARIEAQRARAHYEAALEALGQWLALVDTIDALEG